MELTICSIFDEKSHSYAQPFAAPSVAHAKRTFGDFCNDRETVIGMHPADFTLFKVGVFDMTTGKLVVIGPDVLGNGVEFVAQGGGPVAVSA